MLTRRPRRHRSILITAAAVAAAAGAALSTTPLRADLLTWDNGNGDSLFATANNWDPAAVPSSLDDLLFPSSIPGNLATITLAGAQAAHGLTFKNNYTLTGGTLNLSAPIVDVSFGALAMIQSQLNGSAGLTKTGNGTLRLNGANTYSGATAVNAGVLDAASSAAFGSI